MHLKPLLSFCLVTTLALNSLYAENSFDEDLGGFDTQEILDTKDELLDELDGFDEEPEDELSDDLDGFSDEEILVDEIQALEEKPSLFTISGDMAFKTSLGLKDHKVDDIQYKGINQAQTSLYLQLDSKLSDDWKLRVSGDAFYDAIYDIKSNNDYIDDIKDEYKTQIRLDDAYVLGSLSSDIDLKVGRQIVVWGKSDSIRVTDVINPMDNRQPGMTDIEDLRLSIGMAKLDYYVGEWNFSAMVIGESRIMIEAPARSEYFPVDTIFTVPGGVPDPFLHLETPNSTWRDMQYAFALNGVFSGYDISFYGAYVLDQKWHFKTQPSPTMPLASVKRVVNKVKMLGSAVNVAYGSWLLKSEVAFLEGVRYNTTRDDKSRLDTLLGFDYMGYKDTVLSLEVVNRHIFDYEQQMQYQADFVDMNEMQTAMRATHSFLNDSLNANILVSVFGSSWENGGFTRIWAEYDVMDSVVANFGMVDYMGGEKPLMEANKDNDRIFMDISYSF